MTSPTRRMRVLRDEECCEHRDPVAYCAMGHEIYTLEHTACPECGEMRPDCPECNGWAGGDVCPGCQPERPCSNPFYGCCDDASCADCKAARAVEFEEVFGRV